MHILGIDPGISGALVFIDTEEQTIRIFDMPTFEFTTVKKRTKIDPNGISSYIKEISPSHAYVEDIYSSPQMGVTSSFNFGEGKGIILGICAALYIPLTLVKPTQWKKDMRVPADKKAAAHRASQLLPAVSGQFKGPRGGTMDGRAEAALLALYGAMEQGITFTKPLELSDA